MIPMLWEHINDLKYQGIPCSVAFTGHRSCDQEDVKAWLRANVFEPLHTSVSEWICGGALGVDSIAADLVMEYGGNLHLELPFQNMEKYWRVELRARIQRHRAYAKETGTLSDNVLEYKGSQTYLTRDRKMVDLCNILVAVLDDSSHSGTKYTVDYAINQNNKDKKHLIKRYNPVTKESSEFWQ